MDEREPAVQALEAGQLVTQRAQHVVVPLSKVVDDSVDGGRGVGDRPAEERRHVLIGGQRVGGEGHRLDQQLLQMEGLPVCFRP